MSVQDVLGDAFETYLTLEDAKLIRDTFKNNPRLMRTLQKVFIPTIQDPEMPPEQMAADFWLQGKDWSNVPAEEVKPMIVGRQEALQFILGGLMRIKSIANVKDESKLEEAHRRAKDSTK